MILFKNAFSVIKEFSIDYQYRTVPDKELALYSRIVCSSKNTLRYMDLKRICLHLNQNTTYWFSFIFDEY